MALAADPGGESTVGLDPQLFGDLINSLSRQSATAQGLVSKYIGQLSECGLDTSRMTAAARDLGWAQDQLPMLNRRQSLAQAWEQQNPGMGPMVDAGAGYLDFPTDQAATQAGQADGAKALQALQDRSNTDFIASELAAHAGDPAYLAAFFSSLGPHGLAQLGLQVNGYKQQGNNAQYQLWAGTVGTALATASYRMPFTSKWLSQISLPQSDATSPELDLIQPFLENGVYSPAWLKPLGQYALQQLNDEALQPGMLMPPPQLDGIWTAIAHNPSFDAQFYSQNFANADPNANFPPSLSNLMTNPMVTGQFIDGAFANMVQAATIAPDPTQFPGLNAAQFAANAQLTVRFFGDNTSAHTSGAVQAALGQIAMNYFGDLASSVRAAAPGVGGQNMPGWNVTATEGQWAAFITEAMHNKTTAADLLTFYAKWRSQQPVDWTQDANVPFHQGYWNHASLGFLNDFMAANYQAAGAPAGNSSDAIAEIAAAGGSAFLTSLVFGPEGGIADALVEGGKDAFQTATENQLKEPFKTVLDAAFSAGVDPKGGDAAAADLTNAQTQWDQTVRQWASPPNPGVPPGLQPNGTALHPVSYLGQTYNGDVHSYEQHYGGTFFDDQTGQLKPIEDIQHDPKALAAYNAWLQDPAVVSANGPAFSTTAAGQTWSGYARGFGGGGGG